MCPEQPCNLNIEITKPSVTNIPEQLEQLEMKLICKKLLPNIN